VIKLFYSVRRKAGITPEELSEHWLYPHAPLGVRDPRVLRYIQYHPVFYDPLADSRPPGNGDQYDGVAAAWWKSAETMKEYNTTPQIIEDQKDMRFFIDHERSVGEIVEEDVIIEPEGLAPIVVFQFLARRDGLTRDEFQARWKEDGRSGPLGEHLKGAQRDVLVQGYIQNYSLPEGESSVEELDDLGHSREAWDGFGLYYCNSIATVKALASSSHADALLWSRDNEYVDASRSLVTVMRRMPQKETAGVLR
jgi:hypothetical protein